MTDKKPIKNPHDALFRLLAWRPLILRLMAEPGGQQIMNRLYSYVSSVSNDREQVRAAYARISKTTEEQYMKTIAEQYIEEGRQQGRQQGRQEGEQMGLQQGVQQGVHLAMLTLIEQRFGKVPANVVQLIENAKANEIDQWMRRILAAATLDDLLT